MKLFEQIFNEAHFTETSYSNLVEDSNLRDLFNKYNKEYFDDELSVDKIGWSSRKSQHRGAACGKDYQGHIWIEINPVLECYPDLKAFRDLLVHEMIHIIHFDHDTGFQKVMNDLNNKYGLHVSIYAEGEILKSLQSYSSERKQARADKIYNNRNKPELQKMYDNFNKKFFGDKLDKTVILKYLPAKSFKTYGLAQVRGDGNSDWVVSYQLNRHDTAKWLLKAMIAAYCLLTLGLKKDQASIKAKELEKTLGEKAGYNYSNTLD